MTFISYYTGRTLSMLKYSAGLRYRQSLKFPMQQSRGITLLCIFPRYELINELNI